MSRTIDEAKAPNEDQERMRRGDGTPVDGPHWLEPLARVIGIGPKSVGPVAAWDPGDSRGR